jgi:hypothetical protein
MPFNCQPPNTARATGFWLGQRFAFAKRQFVGGAGHKDVRRSAA